MFSQVCVCPTFGRVPHPRSRQGGYPIQPMGGTPSQVKAGRYPIQLRGGTPSQVQVGYPIQLMGVPCPRLRWGVPHPRSRLMGVPWGTPHPDLGLDTPHPRLDAVSSPPPHQDLGLDTPHPRLDGVPPSPPPTRRQSSIASTCYVAGGMYPAFTKEDFLVIICLESYYLISCCKNVIK